MEKDFRKIGWLALMVFGEELPLQVLESGNGFYVGTVGGDDGAPCSRESFEYGDVASMPSTR